MKSSKAGFTLTEILVVIAIIGVILAISIPSIVYIRGRINERLFENKKQQILISAEMYARDKKLENNTIIYVYTLIDNDYVDAEVNSGNVNCTGEHNTNGCILNPVDDSSLNEEKILIRVNGKSVIAIWNGEEGSTTDQDLVLNIKNELNCEDVTESNPCIYTGNNPNNYLYYSGVMWRILGVYLIDNKEVVKMITDDTVLWETNV